MGVTYDFVDLVIRIKDDRKKDLIRQIQDLIDKDHLDPGMAGKLKGKLLFAAGQFWGKVGRAFLLALSERQYHRGRCRSLGPALSLALNQWKDILSMGRPRELVQRSMDDNDVVIFTDGYYPEPGDDHSKRPRLGGVIFAKKASRAVSFSWEVPQHIIDKWLPRSTQIVMIEALAPIIALDLVREDIKDASVMIFVDSEAAEGALIKGYSSREDLCELTGVFWKMVMDINVLVYIDRVSTDANIADLPSRGDMSIAQRLGWDIREVKTPSEL